MWQRSARAVALLLLAATAMRTCHGQPIISAASSPSGPTPPLAAATIGSSVQEAPEEIAAPETLESQASTGGYRQTQFKLSLLPEPQKTAESVNLEREALPSKVLSAYDSTQKKLADISNPLPILDTISEHEKYGNQGDMFDGVSRTIVNGYEAFSNLLNHFIQRPKELARSISRGVTAQLDIIGGKLVGL